MKYPLIIIALSSLLSITLLSGCKTTAPIYGNSKQDAPLAGAAPDAGIAQAARVATEGQAVQTPQVLPSIQTSPLDVIKQLWLGNKTLIKAPTDPLPAYLDAPRAVKLTISEPQVLQVILGRLGARVSTQPRPVKTGRSSQQKNLSFEIEERAGRSEGENLRLPKSPTLTIDWNGPLSGLLDAVASKSGYRWHYSAANRRVTFYRYHDQEYASHLPKPQKKWVADPKRHTSLRQVLQSWAKQSGWALSWSPTVPDYTFGAKASFSGSFEEAVTALAETNRTIAPIVPWFYYENKQLVIRDAKEEKS